ncbi:MAG: DUF4139 domain-containing protein [Myxococcota bacterium]|nr:DUF4139 domain-containing protein [Myxococcota bacterium]
MGRNAMRAIWIFAAALSVTAAGEAAAQQAARAVSDASGRQTVNLTIYNNNLALVRETRRIDLPRGTVALRYEDVARQVRPETVYIRDVQDPAAVAVLEQNYKYDVLTPSRLIELHVDRDITLVRQNPATGAEQRVGARILSTGTPSAAAVYGYDPYGGGMQQPAFVDSFSVVYRTEEGITFGDVGRIVFPGVPENFVARPTLEWLLNAPRGGQRTIEATYLTYGMSWQSDYVLVLAEDERKGDLAGWVTLRNDAGISFRDVRLQLVAGDVSIEPQYQAHRYGMAAMAQRRGGGYGAGGFAQEGMFEYHLYTLERNTDIADREQKQVQLLDVDGVPMEKKYRLHGDAGYYISQYAGSMEDLRVAVWIEFVNAGRAGLGVALPAGVIRVYKADSSGAQQFIGEDRIGHTPREERIKLELGKAFDIAAERKQTDYEILSGDVYEAEWEIKIRNRKTEAVVVEVLEPMAGDWEVVSKTHEFVTESARLVRFDVTCPPDREVVLRYRIRTRY